MSQTYLVHREVQKESRICSCFFHQDQLEKLLRKYYGYVADLEGAGLEILDLLFVRDAIQAILEQSRPATELSSILYSQVYQVDALLWQQKTTLFLQVLGERELCHARRQQQSLRSHWWWYLDQMQLPMRMVEASPLQPEFALASSI